MEINLIIGLTVGIMIASLGSIGIFFLYIRFFTGKTISYRIMEPIGQRYFILKKGKVKLKETNFKWNNFSYKINSNLSIEDKKRFSIEKILYYTKENEQPLSFFKIDKVMGSRQFKAYTEAHDYEELMKDSAQEKMYLLLVVGLVIALVVVIVYSQYSMSQLNEKILQLMRNITTQNLNPIR